MWLRFSFKIYSETKPFMWIYELHLRFRIILKLSKLCCKVALFDMLNSWEMWWWVSKEDRFENSLVFNVEQVPSIRRWLPCLAPQCSSTNSVFTRGSLGLWTSQAKYFPHSSWPQEVPSVTLCCVTRCYVTHPATTSVVLWRTIVTSSKFWVCHQINTISFFPQAMSAI